MVLRFTNTAILALIVVLTLTGLYGLVFSLQRWAGVRLVDLLQAAGMARPAKLVGLEAVGGYGHLYSATESEAILLATHVGGEPLAHRYGFPLRAVVPARRGWFWVKWLSRASSWPDWPLHPPRNKPSLSL